MPGISTHVLDTARGRPAAGMGVSLEFVNGAEPRTISSTVTDEDGRVTDLLGGSTLQPGTYRISFATGGYGNTFYPEASVVFVVEDPNQHHHIPLLLSPFGYSTYRGS